MTDGKKTYKIKMFIFLGLIILMAVVDNEVHANNAVVTISVRLKNIAISKDLDSQAKNTVNEPAGLDYSIGHMVISNEEIKDTKGEAASRYPEIDKEVTKIEKETKWGRTIDIQWKIVNYEPAQGILCSIPSNGYHLFGITWNGRKIDYRFRNIEGMWKFGQSVPTIFRFKSPLPATIKGVGDVPVFIPGVNFDLKKIGLWNIDKVISKENYAIVINRYPIAKTLHLQAADMGLEGKKLEIEGLTTLGDSGIKTERIPFWFPFDKYSFEFTYTSFFPSHVTIHMEEVEDLVSSSPMGKLEYYFPAGLNTKVFNIILKRNLSFENIIRSTSLIFTITPFFVRLIERRRKKRFRLLWKIIGYTIAGFIVYLLLPKPLNVPMLNLYSLAAALVFVFCIARYEVSPYWKAAAR